jgi:CMP-2-keto-3-deoxyoctulosonic acid synthetase
MIDMWSALLRKFEKYPAQQKVLKVIFERGFQVNDDGKVTSGSIEIAHTQLAREAGVDRRVVDSTTEVILSDEQLKKVFQNIKSIPFLRDVGIGEWYKNHQYFQHLGMYAYRSEILEKLSRLSYGDLERAESLEQLRWLENGYRIKTAETVFESFGIDTRADLEEALNSGLI